MEDKEKRVAVLIDAENVSSKYIEIILNEAISLGNIIIKRIYGDWTNLTMSSWKSVILNNSVQPIQQYSNVTGKNSSDSALIIDAMDLLYQGRLDVFRLGLHPSGGAPQGVGDVRPRHGRTEDALKLYQRLQQVLLHRSSLRRK